MAKQFRLYCSVCWDWTVHCVCWGWNKPTREGQQYCFCPCHRLGCWFCNYGHYHHHHHHCHHHYHYCYWSLLYSAILRSRADSLRSHVILHEWIAFHSAFLNIHRSGGLKALAWLVPYETAAISARSVYTIQPCHFMQSHIRKVYACLAVTCHLHFWQNDRGLLRATAVTRGWNGYRNKSQHRKSTLEKKILPPLQQGFEPATFQSWVWRSNHWAIPVPRSSSTAAVLSPSPSLCS